jgi:hypothetical protein
MNIPTFITHYFLKTKSPFLSLSELEGGNQNPIFKEMLYLHTKDETYKRRYGMGYIDTRLKTESKMRKKFIEKGGKPKDQFPTYFVLGESLWFKNLNANHSEFNVELSNLSPEVVSITYPDSFISFNNPTKIYHDQVYLKSELNALIERFGLPSDDKRNKYDQYWLDDDGFEKYVEVQVWDKLRIQELLTINLK